MAKELLMCISDVPKNITTSLMYFQKFQRLIMAMATCVISRHFGFPRQELKKKKAYTKYFKSALCLDAHGAFFFSFSKS